MDIKIANNDYPIHELLKNRWSPRAFENKFIEPELVRGLFEAARWSPSASNLQPWYFIAGFKGDDTYDNIFSTLVEFNQLWAKTAPLLFVSVAKLTNHKGEANVSAMYDVGQAVALLSVQAMASGLYVHQMGGFNTKLISELFDIPEDYNSLTVVAVGYKGRASELHPNLEKMEVSARERRKAADSVFSGKFGQSSKIF